MSVDMPELSLRLLEDAGHAGASGGAGHYRVRIAAAAFIGRPLLACHRLVYDAVADWMPSRIHALAIEIARSQV